MSIRLRLPFTRIRDRLAGRGSPISTSIPSADKSENWTKPIEHSTYQGTPHPCCKCEACSYWYPKIFEVANEKDKLAARIEELEAVPKMMTTVDEVMEATGWVLSYHGDFWDHRSGPAIIGRIEVERNLELLGIRREANDE